MPPIALAQLKVRRIRKRSRGMSMDHVQGCAPFGMVIRLSEIALYDQARTALHQCMTDKTELPQHQTICS